MDESDLGVQKEFGRRVREQRLALGLTQETLAARVGCHWSYVGQVENGRRNASLLNLVRLAQGLSIDPGELLAGMDTSFHGDTPGPDGDGSPTRWATRPDI